MGKGRRETENGPCKHEIVHVSQFIRVHEERTSRGLVLEFKIATIHEAVCLKIILVTI